MDRELSRDRQPRRSVSPRSDARFQRNSQSPVSEARTGGRNGNRSSSRSSSRSRSTSRGRPRSRTRSRSWSRSYRSRRYSRSPSQTTRSSKIVVEKLTKNVTEQHLLEIFGSFGEIQSIDLPLNHAFMTNRGTAYILYYDPADAEAAISHMHEAQLDGAVLNVSIVLPKRAFSRSPPPVSNVRGKYGRGRYASRRPSDSRPSRNSPYHQRASPRRYGRPLAPDRHDTYRPRSRSRSPHRSRSASSRSPSVSQPRRRRAHDTSSRRDRRRSPSYSSYDYSSRSRSRSRSTHRGYNQRVPSRR
ncbi:hypothetical protein BDV18DRAFT_143393 [Aspergillus unguis]